MIKVTISWYGKLDEYEVERAYVDGESVRFYEGEVCMKEIHLPSDPKLYVVKVEAVDVKPVEKDKYHVITVHGFDAASKFWRYVQQSWDIPPGKEVYGSSWEIYIPSNVDVAWLLGTYLREEKHLDIRQIRIA
jgi:hypothetical protein